MTSEYSGTGKASTEKEATRWLSIVGIGEDGLDGLGKNALRAIEAAEIVFGGKRHLDLAAAAIQGEARARAIRRGDEGRSGAARQEGLRAGIR